MTDEYSVYRKKFRNLLFVQLTLIMFAASAFVYISSEAHKELKEYQRISVDRDEAAVQRDSAEARRDEARKEYEELRANIEKLYSVRVTKRNQVFELKATAQATGENYQDGKPMYKFRIYVNSPAELLSNIEKVTYDFDHPTFANPHRETTKPETRFQIRYTGWGCLTKVHVEVLLKDSSVQNIDFNMCKSIGWE